MFNLSNQSNLYMPEEDSYFLSEFIEKEIREMLENNQVKFLNVLDMGSGTGVQAKTLLKSGIPQENIILADINKKSTNFLRNKFQDIKIVNSDLFNNIDGKFDLIVFNPPYLPEDEYDKEKDTTGGKKGSETINNFLEQSKRHLSEKGKILLLTSNLTKGIKWEGFRKKLLGTKNLFFERLYVWRVIQDYKE